MQRKFKPFFFSDGQDEGVFIDPSLLEEPGSNLEPTDSTLASTFPSSLPSPAIGSQQSRQLNERKAMYVQYLKTVLRDK